MFPKLDEYVEKFLAELRAINEKLDRLIVQNEAMRSR